MREQRRAKRTMTFSATAGIMARVCWLPTMIHGTGGVVMTMAVTWKEHTHTRCMTFRLQTECIVTCIIIGLTTHTSMLTIMSCSIVDTVGELPEKAERNDGQGVEALSGACGARFNSFAPRGGVGPTPSHSPTVS